MTSDQTAPPSAAPARRRRLAVLVRILGAVLCAVSLLMLLATVVVWFWLPRWAPLSAVSISPWPDPAVRAALELAVAPRSPGGVDAAPAMGEFGFTVEEVDARARGPRRFRDRLYLDAELLERLRARGDVLPSTLLPYLAVESPRPVEALILFRDLADGWSLADEEVAPLVALIRDRSMTEALFAIEALYRQRGVVGTRAIGELLATTDELARHGLVMQAVFVLVWHGLDPERAPEVAAIHERLREEASLREDRELRDALGHYGETFEEIRARAAARR